MSFAAGTTGCGSSDLLDEGEICERDNQCKAGLKCLNDGTGTLRCTGGSQYDARVFDGRTADAGPAPDTVIDTKPPAITNSTSAAFTFSSVPAGGTFECQLNEDTFKPCTASQTFTVPEGSNTLRVRATLGGATDPTPAMYTWLVDRLPPNTVITTKPPATDAPTSVNLGFTTDPIETGVTFTCKLVGPGQAGTEAACTSLKAYSGLTVNSSYTFTAYATDAAGNKDVDGASYTFMTGTADPPVVTATCPAASVQSKNVSIAFTANQAGSTFSCTLTGPGQTGTAGPCTSPKAYTDLGDGNYVFTVTATNGGLTGNPASCNFAINAEAPVVTITAPTEGAKVGRSANVTYTVAPTEPGLTFTCEAVQGESTKTAECGAAGTASFSGLVIGAVTFRVTVRDTGGNTSTDTVNAVVTAGPGVAITLTPFFNGFTRAKGSASFALMGDFTSVAYVCTLNGATVDGCAPGTPIPWDSLNLVHGDKVTVTVKATDNMTGEFTETTAEAIVDEQGPVCGWIFPPELSVVGSFVQAIFTCDGGSEFTCTIDGAPTPCAPDEPVVAVLSGGMHVFTAATSDELGNPSNTATLNLIVDTIGPTATVTQLPENATCPTSTAETEIRFDLKDFTLRNVANASNIRRADCILDGATVFNCLTGGHNAVFRWDEFAHEGRHTLRIVAYDQFGNPGPRNPDNTLGLEVVFFIDATPPTLELAVASEIFVDGGLGHIRVTSGGGGVGGYGDINVAGADPDGPDPDQVPDHEPLTLTNCTITPVEGGDPIDCTATCVKGEGEDWVCTFAGLANGHYTVTATIEDSCGSINEDDISETWLVDATSDDIAFQNFIDGINVVARDPAGPANDIIDGTATLPFTITDQPQNDEYDSSANPVLLQCQVDGGNVTCATLTGAGPVHSSSIPVTGLTDASNPHSATVNLQDGVGNPSTSTINFIVDSTPPAVTFNASPQVDSCTDAGGLPVTDATGTITFTAVDTASPADPDNVAAGIRSVTCSLLGLPGDVVIATDADCADGQFAFAALANGTYTLEVVATDNVGNVTTARRGTFRVDASAPIVTPASPRAPVARGTIDATVGCDGGDECTLFANIKPAEATAGTFIVDVDASTQPITFVCTVDGNTVPCTPGLVGGYDISTLTEGAIGAPTTHTSVIQATDCVGNSVPTPVSVNFFIDERSPVGTPTAPALTTDNTGNVTATFNIADNVTNIQSAFCVIDFDPATGNNPDTGGPFGESVPCTLDNLLPSQGVGPSGDGTITSHSATLAMSQLSAGNHRLFVKYADIWGHLSATWTTVDFTVDYNPNKGHAVAIGHDFVDTSDDTTNLIGNAVELTSIDELANFDRGINVLVLDLGNADAGESEGSPPEANVLDALNTRLADLGACAASGPCYNVRTFGSETPTEYTKIQSYLYGRDAFVILDQNAPGASLTVGANAAWQAALLNFVNHGGIVVVLDGRFNGTPSQTIEIVDGVIESNNADSGFNPSGGIAELDCNSTNPLALDVGFSSEGEAIHYTAPFASARFTVDPQANEVFSMCEDTPGGCSNYNPVVMDKIFPIRANVGPARVAAWEDGQRRDSNSYAVFSQPSGAEIVTCALRQDGTAAHDITSGGTITIAATIDICSLTDAASYPVQGCASSTACEDAGGTCNCNVIEGPCLCEFTRPCDGLNDQECTCTSNNSLESVMAVQLFETITVGRSDRPVEAVGTASVQLTARPGAVTYHVSVGCFSDDNLADDDDGDDLLTNFRPCVTVGSGEFVETNCARPSWITNRCAYRDGDVWKINVYAEARGDNGEQEAFAFIPGVPLNGNNVFAATVGTNDWKQVLDQDRFFVNYSGTQTTTFETADVSLGSIIGSILYGESRKPSQIATGVDGPYFSPTAANVFQNVYRVNGIETFGTDGSHSVPSINTLTLNQAVVDPPDTVVLDRSKFMPRFSAFDMTFGGGAASLTWNGDAGPGSYAGADLGLATLFVNITGECSNALWVLAFPGSSGPVVTPDVSNVPGCYTPQDVFFGALSFYDNSAPGATVDVARADFYAFVPDFLRGFLFDYPGHTSRPANTVETSASTLSSFNKGKR